MRQRPSKDITEERLERALQTMAAVVDYYGDTYWPLFDALKRILDEKRERRRELAKYRSASSSSDRGEFVNVRDIRSSARLSR